MSFSSVGRKSKGQTADGGCTHCGNPKHTWEICFKLHGYPEWWKELKESKTRESNSREDTRRAAFTNTDHESILKVDNDPTTECQKCQDNTGCGLFSSKHDLSTSWIIDSGASDHMTFDPRDLQEKCSPKRSRISNANGVIYPVTGAGRVALTPSLSLKNTLLVPSLTNKLLSVGQATDELNCCVLMYPTFCLF